MSSKGVPLDAETETKLVDAMYRARTESKTPDLSGPSGMQEMAKGNIVETYREKLGGPAAGASCRDSAKFSTKPR